MMSNLRGELCDERAVGHVAGDTFCGRGASFRKAHVKQRHDRIACALQPTCRDACGEFLAHHAAAADNQILLMKAPCWSRHDRIPGGTSAALA